MRAILFMVTVVFVFAILPLHGQTDKHSAVPVEVKKYAKPVSNPEALDNPNAGI